MHTEETRIGTNDDEWVCALVLAEPTPEHLAAAALGLALLRELMEPYLEEIFGKDVVEALQAMGLDKS